MKKYLGIYLFTFLFCGTLFSQVTKGDTKDAYNAKKVAFITREMGLTTAEAEKLWPLYNEFEQKKDDIRKERIKARKKFASGRDKLSEKECEELIDQEMEYHQKETDLQKERHRRLKKILTMKKIAMLYKAEEDFKAAILKEMYGKKGKDGGTE